MPKRNTSLVSVRTCSTLIAALVSLLASHSRADSIPICVRGDGPDLIWPAPVKFGVPFPQDVLKPGAPVQVVDQSGTPQLAQTLVTATWDPKGKKGVRWLLVDFLAERDQSYRLVFGADIAAATPQGQPIARETDHAIAIDTGALRARCSRTAFDLFRSFQTRHRRKDLAPAMLQEVWAGPYVEHEKRGVFRADLDPEATIIVEENGPVRATLKADGWYTNEAGERFCRFSLRAHFFKGKPDVKLEHTFIFTGRSLEDRIRDIGIQLPLAGKRNKRFCTIFGVQLAEDQTGADPLENCSDHVYQVMDSPDHRRFEWLVRDVGKDQIIRNGVKAGGWMRVWTDRASLMAVIRDAWQQYPFELEWEKTIARVHLWPKHGRIWDTSFDGIWYFLTDRQKRYLVERKPKVGAKNFDRIWKKLRRSHAQGAAKTHEVWLFFDAGGHWGIGSTSYADRVHRPVYAHADLAWQCQTRALDWVLHHPYDPTLFRDEENYAETMLDLMRKHVDFAHYYGWWDWGGYHQHLPLYPGDIRRGNNTFENTYYQPGWHRAKPKSHYYWGSYPWLMYLRTGELKWLRYAQTYTHYSADRAFVHHSDKATGRIAGEEYHYDNSEIHWIGGYYGAPGGAIACGNITDRNDYVYQYWLTGDRRPLDVLEMWGESFAAQIKAGSLWLKRMADAGPYGNWSRNVGGMITRACIYYEATWDRRFLEYAKMLAETFYDLDVHRTLRMNSKDDKSLLERYNMWYAAWVYDGLFRYYRVTGDEKVRKAAVDFCRASTDYGAGFGSGGNESGILKWCTYGYELTQDALFLDLGRRAVDREIGLWVSRRSFKPGGRKFRVVSTPRFLGAMAHAPESWRRRNLPTHQRGVSLDLLYYHPNWAGKTKRVYLLDEDDAEFRIHFGAFQAGTFAVFDPDGRIVARTEPIDWRKSIRTTVKVPKDGKRGTYTLACIEFGKTPYSKRWWDYRAHLCIIGCDLPKIVYDASFRPGEGMAFRARAWYFGVPANADGVEAHWRPSAAESGGQRDFAIEEVGGAWRRSTKDMVPVNRYSSEAYGDFNRYTFRIPPAPRARLFRCEPLCEPHRVLVREGAQSVRGFVIIGAPPYIATSPESYFVPNPPKVYEKP